MIKKRRQVIPREGLLAIHSQGQPALNQIQKSKNRQLCLSRLIPSSLFVTPEVRGINATATSLTMTTCAATNLFV